MTAAERERIGTTSKTLTNLIASLRDEIKSLKKHNAELEKQYAALNVQFSIVCEEESQCRLRIIKLKGDLSAKDIEIRRLETEILRLKMIIDEKA